MGQRAEQRGQRSGEQQGQRTELGGAAGDSVQGSGEQWGHCAGLGGAAGQAAEYGALQRGRGHPRNSICPGMEMGTQGSTQCRPQAVTGGLCLLEVSTSAKCSPGR